MYTTDCDVFISYRRLGSEALAMLLHDRLEDAGYRVFLDVESLRSGNFNTAILKKIEACTDVLVLLPPNALDRCVNEDDWLRLEVEHAFLHGKNVVPVMLRGFEWPDSLPEGMAQLPDCNGVSAADNMELFDGVLLRIQDKLLRSRPVPRAAEDPAFTRLYHRFQYLIFSADMPGADGIAKQLMEQYPDRAESYLCRVQHSFRVSSLELLGLSVEAFEEDSAWRYALHIAPPALKTKLEGILAESRALRKKRAEEARREEEIRRLQQPRPKPKSKPAKAAAVSEPPKAISEEEASRIIDTILARMRRLNEHPLAAETRVRELYAIRDMIAPIQHVHPVQEILETCTQTIDMVRKEMAEEALAASEILSCYDVLGEIQGVHKQLAGKSVPDGTVTKKDIKLDEGVVQCCMRSNCRLALLADGSVIPLDAATHTWLGTEAHRWDDITWLDGSMPAGVRGFRKDGTYVFAADEVQPSHYECEAITDSPFEYRASGVQMRKLIVDDVWVEQHPDGTSEILTRGICMSWQTAFGTLLLGCEGCLQLMKDGTRKKCDVLEWDVIGIYVRDNICLALLRSGQVVEINLSTRKRRFFACAMTEEAVQMGVRSWRRNRAEELLALRKKQLRNPALLALALLGGSFLLGPAGWAGAGAAAFSLANRRKKCQESIESLNALLAEQ